MRRITVEEWPALPNLETLEFHCVESTVELLPASFLASSLPSLTSLRLSFGPGIKDVDLPVLRGLFPHVRSLRIYGFSFSGAKLSHWLLQPLAEGRLPSLCFVDLVTTLQRKCVCPPALSPQGAPKWRRR